MREKVKPRKVTCIICGTEFTTSNANKLCCSKECSKERSKQKQRENWHQNKRLAEVYYTPPKKREPRVNVDVNINLEKAKAEGLSYGQYMAKQQAKLVRIERQ